MTTEKIAKLSTLVFESITKTALTAVELEKVRADRSAPSERIYDAAQAHRGAEHAMNEAVQDLVAAQAAELRKTG